MSDVDEYLRRNLLLAKAVGASSNAKAALDRVRAWKGARPVWLMRALDGIWERSQDVACEMARHRDEVNPNE